MILLSLCTLILSRCAYGQNSNRFAVRAGDVLYSLED